jgi:8-oxo-dGTP pyrophosphatase MutT (NUDIX family)
MIVIKNEDRYLLGKRSDLKAKAPGFWCPISGHIEDGESEIEAVIREAEEELGVSVTPRYKLKSTLTHDKTVILHWWLTDIISGVPHLNNGENSQLGWFSPSELRVLKPSFEEDLQILLTI